MGWIWVLALGWIELASGFNINFKRIPNKWLFNYTCFQLWAANLQDEHGNDGDVTSLRSALIQIEREGLVDYELSGHLCNRPATVCQGSEEIDRFHVHYDYIDFFVQLL